MQAELRRVAVNTVLGGMTRVAVARAIGVKRRFVGGWMRAYETQGGAALAGGRRGRRPGEQKALNRQQEAMIRRMIEPRRACRRLQALRGWRDGEVKDIDAVFGGGTVAASQWAATPGRRSRARSAMSLSMPKAC